MEASRQALRDALAVIRFPITLIGMTSTLAIGWLLTSRYLVGLAAVVGVDWFLINLMNRVTDIDEDLRNGIRGTERIARRKAAVAGACFSLQIASLLFTHWIWPSLTPYRLLVQGIGLAYNYRLLPAPGGWRRLKELYFFKNFGSACIFALTSFAYPVAATGVQKLDNAALWLLIAFFIPFEMTYEVLYDLRDYEGDRAAKIPTFPVAHGPRGARRLIDGLLIASSVILVLGLVRGVIGLREGLMLAAPAVQFFAYRFLLRRGLNAGHCIALTHLGTFLLAFFLAGNRAWLALDLPANIYLVSRG